MDYSKHYIYEFKYLLIKRDCCLTFNFVLKCYMKCLKQKLIFFEKLTPWLTRNAHNLIVSIELNIDHFVNKNSWNLTKISFDEVITTYQGTTVITITAFLIDLFVFKFNWALRHLQKLQLSIENKYFSWIVADYQQFFTDYTANYFFYIIKM